MDGMLAETKEIRWPLLFFCCGLFSILIPNTNEESECLGDKTDCYESYDLNLETPECVSWWVEEHQIEKTLPIVYGT